METLFAEGAFFAPTDVKHKNVVSIRWRVARQGPEGPTAIWIVHFGTIKKEFATRKEAWDWLSLYTI